MEDAISEVVIFAERTMHTISHPGLFSSACLLLQIRIMYHRQVRLNFTSTQSPDVMMLLYQGKGDTERACRRTAKKHMAPTEGILACKKCHSAGCFLHILNTGFHASEALKWHSRDTTSEIWHSKHIKVRERKAQIDEAVKEMRAADETGGPCDMRLVIVENARVYPSCNPISGYVRPGWYDDAWPTELDAVSMVMSPTN